MPNPDQPFDPKIYEDLQRVKNAELRRAEEERVIQYAFKCYKKLKRKAGEFQQYLIVQSASPGKKANPDAPIVSDHALVAVYVDFVLHKQQTSPGKVPPARFPQALEAAEKLHPGAGQFWIGVEFHPKEGQPWYDAEEDKSEIYFLEQGSTGLLKKQKWFSYLKTHYRRDPGKARTALNTRGEKILVEKAPSEMYGISIKFSPDSPEEMKGRAEKTREG